ncbi:hypothetical protein [Actinophytocola algeriensis]|uniref:Uncharacterized protein n=1 Tax=Actinophytocola algeriensis TaxID=1768010 RepID=A0A7W7VJE5_9PSEU|nr:hypothetical protein [Actinophytocola algeriensis]MBB4912254.1 hypothetical protein [Actinophytocola algeriensis]MBE1474230.1 hypothetical protein [Actinophytocola algeriensis]
MSTKDELWQWLGEPLQELSRHRLEQPEAEWQERRVYFLEKLSITDPAPYPAVDALLRHLDELPEDQRDALLDNPDELTRVADDHLDQYAEAAQETPEEAGFDQQAWWAFLAENATLWNGTDEHWAEFEPWLLSAATDHGFGEATEALLAPVRGQGADAVRAVLAEYGVVIPEQAPAEPGQAQEIGQVEVPTPTEFADANMAELLAEDPEFAELSEERRMALIAEVLAEQNH